LNCFICFTVSEFKQSEAERNAAGRSDVF